MPRIISGTARGIRLQSPEGTGTRPTTDRIKETLFNILSPYLAEARVLDLFAGTGGLCLEAVSRGALSGVMVEADRRCAEIIRFNMEKTSLKEQTELMRMDVSTAISILGQARKQFELVLMDPPYNRNFVVKTLQMLVEHDIIVHDGIAVVEHSLLEVPPDIIGGLHCVRRETYGESCFAFYVYSGNEEDAAP